MNVNRRALRWVLWSLLAVAVVCGAAAVWMTLSNPRNAKTIGELPTPLGYVRAEAPKGSFAEYVRSLPLHPRGHQVQLYTGGNARLQFLSAAVVDMPLLSNAEQCADMAMRFRAEWLYANSRYSDIKFRDVNGKTHTYSGGKSRKAFERFMREMYGVCSTFSVYHETRPRHLEDVQPGDVLVYPARKGHRYGHAVLVADVATNRFDGSKALLCIEGNTPAREAHVVRNPNPFNNPWFFPTSSPYVISAFIFNQDELRHY